jgi:hypothetical protein
MSMLSEQIGAVFAAPIPFVIALLPLGGAMWGAYEWAYRSVLNKRRELYELSRSEVEHWKDSAKRTAEELTELAKKIERADEAATAGPTRALFEQMKQTTSRLSTELDSLARANKPPTPQLSIAEAVRALSKPSATQRID